MTSSAIATQQQAPSIEGLEQVLINGDLSCLSPEQAVTYYARVCESVGLNPLTQPFEYLKLNGKMILYARKAATEQLRRIHQVSISIVSRETVEGCYVVTARATLPNGRCDESVGAVPIQGLRGEALANQLMKCECVPLDSEILTRDGWKTHAQLVVGEEVLAYDLETDTCRWTPVRNVTTYQNAPVVRVESTKGQFSVRCTPNHSWAARFKDYQPDARGDGSRGPRGPYKRRGKPRRLIEAQHLNKMHRIVLAAGEHEQKHSLLSPVEAAILGWTVTDGTIKRVGNSVRIGLCQSKKENFEELREVTRLAAGSDVRELVSEPRVRTFPGGGTYATRAQHWWYLPASVSRALLNKAGYRERSDLPRIVTQLSSKARAAMLQAMMLAEGDQRGGFTNTDPHVLDAFEILCALEGVATGTRTPRKSAGKPIWYQRKKKTHHVAGAFLSVREDGVADVWCPTTDYGTWVMRQNGRVMITGNTKAKRRVTLGICGLAFMDETEVETVRGAERVPMLNPEPPKPAAAPPVLQLVEGEVDETQNVPAVMGTKLRGMKTEAELVRWLADCIRHDFDPKIQNTLGSMLRRQCVSVKQDFNVILRKAEKEAARG